MMFQTYDCYPWMTVAANVRLGLLANRVAAEERNRRVENALSVVGLDKVDKAYPYQLSGGMRQRVALARTLVGSPRVLLMDEPYGALDAQTREDLQGELLALFRQGNPTSVVFVTHDVAEAVRLGSRIVVLSGPPATILYDSPTRRAEVTAPSDEELMLRCRKMLIPVRSISA
jgi:NitT/TauT family transport system ATP-binding protein